MNNKKIVQGYVTALAAGVVGVLLFYHLHMPLPWMLGSLFGALIAANMPGIHVVRPIKLANPVRAVLGLAVGSAFSPALLDEFAQYLLSLSLLLPFLVATVWFGLLYFHKLIGFERHTAFFCSLPGGMMEMTLICEAYGADMRRVALIHTTRVLLIVFTVPFAIHYWTHADLSGRIPLAAPLTELPLDQALILAIAALVGWGLMYRVRLPGAAIVGPMVCGAAVYTLGWATKRVPDELINAAQLILGTSIGCAFVNITLKEMLHAVFMTLGYFVILMILAMGMAMSIHMLTGIPLIATVLAFIPGGHAEMNVIALMINVAVPYITLHHILRMFIVMTVAPPLSAWLLGPSGTPSREQG